MAEKISILEAPPIGEKETPQTVAELAHAIWVRNGEQVFDPNTDQYWYDAEQSLA